MASFDLDRFRLQSDRLLIRRVDIDDLPALYRLYSDPEVMAFASDPAFSSPALMACFFASVEAGYRSGEYYEFSVVLPEVGPIGTCSLHSFDHERREAQIGYLLARSYWRRGLMSEAVARLVQWAGEEMGLAAVAAEVAAGNVASRGLLEKLGFIKANQDMRPGELLYRLTLPKHRGTN